MVVATSCCFSEAGRLVRIEGKTKGAKYRETLDENLLQSAQDLRLGRRFTFQQVNNPKNTAKTAHKYKINLYFNAHLVCIIKTEEERGGERGVRV